MTAEVYLTSDDGSDKKQFVRTVQHKWTSAVTAGDESRMESTFKQPQCRHPVAKTGLLEIFFGETRQQINFKVSKQSDFTKQRKESCPLVVPPKWSIGVLLYCE